MLFVELVSSTRRTYNALLTADPTAVIGCTRSPRTNHDRIMSRDLVMHSGATARQKRQDRGVYRSVKNASGLWPRVALTAADSTHSWTQPRQRKRMRLDVTNNSSLSVVTMPRAALSPRTMPTIARGRTQSAKRQVLLQCHRMAVSLRGNGRAWGRCFGGWRQ